MAPSKPILNQIRHRSWKRREFIPVFVCLVTGSENEGKDFVLWELSVTSKYKEGRKGKYGKERENLPTSPNCHSP
jgi:hypothetical protein